MAKENKEKSQVSWRDLGDNIIADLPGGETITFDMRELHETWKDFMLKYGVKQYVSSAMAKMSYHMPAQVKIDIIDAQIRAGDGDLEAANKLTTLRENAKADKIAWLKTNAAEIRTFMWKEFQALKVAKAIREKAERETKAEVEARAVKAENDRLVALAVENAAKLGIPVEIAMQLMGVKPIVEVEVEVESPKPAETVDVLNDETLDGNE